jgi:hypothetical protein
MERLGADVGERFARSALHHTGASPNPELLIMAAVGYLNQDPAVQTRSYKVDKAA